MKILKFIFLFFLIFIPNIFAGVQIGNDYTIQGYYSFIGADNRIANDAKMENGFTFTDSSTTCSIDVFSPISGLVNLDGGKVFVNRDLYFYNSFALWTGGQIYAKNHLLEFPKKNGTTKITASKNLGGLLNHTHVDRVQMGSNVNSVDWSYDSVYLASGSDTSGSTELNVYSFDGTSLIIKDSEEINDNVNSVRWNPIAHYIAVGIDTNPSTELRIYFYNTGTGLLSLSDEVELGVNIRAVAWSYDGQYLATASTDNLLRLYSFAGGSLGFITSIDFTGNGTISDDAISWKSTGDYIVIGTGGTSDDILVFLFDGSNLSLDSSLNVGAFAVNDVAWKYGSSYIVAGLAGGTQRLKIYIHSGGSLEEVYALDEALIFAAVNWAINEDCLAVGRNTGTGTEFRIYYFDADSQRIMLIDGLESVSNVLSVRFSPDSQKIATGDLGDFVSVYKFEAKSPIVFDNANIILNSDVEITSDTVFRGTCVINGLGKKLILNQSSQLSVESGGLLKLLNLNLLGLANKNFACLQNDASFIFQDCNITLSNNFEFDLGSILFRGDVVISGSCKFVYTTVMGSTIDFNSVLYLDKGLTFSYAPAAPKRDLIYMQDKSSCLFLDECTLFSTKTGLSLINGRLFLDNAINFSNEGSIISQAICFGNGNVNDDLDIQILSDTELKIYGLLDYQNTN
ncbi:WD40 repeat domain-containing protein [Candidatus Dependentiae bacterium]